MGWLQRGRGVARSIGTLGKILHLIHKRQMHMANDLSKLQQAIADLTTESGTVVTTLAGLAQAVVDLKNATTPVDQQVAIDALTVQAQAILTNLKTADTAAETELPVTTPGNTPSTDPVAAAAANSTPASDVAAQTPGTPA